VRVSQRNEKSTSTDEENIGVTLQNVVDFVFL